MINFIHIPKSAGSSFYSIIKDSKNINYIGHSESLAMSKVALNPSIAIVRNPYDRIVSAYFYLMNGGGLNKSDLKYKQMLHRYTGFKNFILAIEKDNLIKKIIHLQPMYKFICEDRIMTTAYLFRFENMEIIDNFLIKLGLQKLSEVQISKSDHAPYIDYMDAEIIKVINRIYAVDFDLFNYKMI